MSNSVSESTIDDFCSITGCLRERAKFYLEAAGGNIDLAVESFFENNDGENDEDDDFSPSSVQDREDLTDPISISKSTNTASQAPSINPQPRQSTINTNNKIFTLNSMRSDNNEEEGQAFYAGGSDQSGQQILGPPRQSHESIIKNLFSKAKESGAQVVESSSTSTASKPTISGTGYRLGTGNEPTEVIRGPPAPKPPKVSVLKLWKNGFTLDQGALRSYTDPENREFLKSIEQGAIPKELLRQNEGNEVHLDMQDHREEEFVPEKPKYVLYNEGYKLGSPTPGLTTGSTSTLSTTTSESDKKLNEEKAKSELKLNESAPTTQIQVRLNDGSRLIIKLNLTHNLNDLRNYINRARPEYASINYALMTSFPNKELTNNNETIEQAKLQNAAIILKTK